MRQLYNLHPIVLFTELESYSHIISVFRAQGSLSEPKAKLLEELRQLFHITQERHRAEVRRAANDEQLCTIAEKWVHQCVCCLYVIELYVLLTFLQRLWAEHMAGMVTWRSSPVSTATED